MQDQYVRHTIYFGACMKNLARVMGEPGQVRTVFLARNRLGRSAFLDIIDLDRVVVT